MKIKELLLKYQEKVFPVLDIGLNGVNYLFHIFCSWYVSQQNYGTLNALLSILSILLVAGITFQTYTAKEVAQNGIAPKRIYKTSFLYIGILTIIFLVFIEKINEFTKSSYISLALIFSVFILNLFLSILRGIFQGEKKFFDLNMSFYVENLAKVGFVVMFLPRYRNIDIVFIGLIFGMIVGIIHGIMRLKIGTLIVRDQGKIKPVARRLSIIYLSNFFIYYFTSIDMVIFNYKLSEVSGIYAVVLRYSQIILFISFSLITVFIPNLSSKVDDRDEFLKRVRKYFLILIGCQGILLILYKTTLPQTVNLLFGSDYSEAGNYLMLGALMYIMLVNSFYLVNVNVILNRKKYVFPLGFTATLITYYLINYGDSIALFLIGGTILYTLLFLTLLIIFYIEGVDKFERKKQEI